MAPTAPVLVAPVLVAVPDLPATPPSSAGRSVPPRPSAYYARGLAPVSAPVSAYLDALARAGRSAGWIGNVRKTCAAAERTLGPLLDADTAAWDAYVRELERTRTAQRTAILARQLRRVLAHAGAPIPDALAPYNAPDPLPPAWRDALAAWGTYLAAAGTPATTAATRNYHVAQFAAHGGTTDPATVTAGDLLAWMGSHGHWAPETRYGHRGSLRAFYRWAHHVAGLVPSDPAALLPRVKRPAPVARPLPPEHLRDALAAAHLRGDDRLPVMLTLAAGYGLRRAEIAQVHTADLLTWAARDGAHLHELVVHGKGRKDRRVPVTDDLAERITAAGGYLFPGNDGGHLSARWVGKLLSRALPDGFTGHTARHLFATTAYRVTGDLFTLQTVLGHASAETTRRYVLTDDDAARRVVAAVAPAVGLTAPTPPPTGDGARLRAVVGAVTVAPADDGAGV